jgi:hypothetical protein
MVRPLACTYLLSPRGHYPPVSLALSLDRIGNGFLGFSADAKPYHTFPNTLLAVEIG